VLAFFPCHERDVQQTFVDTGGGAQATDGFLDKSGQAVLEGTVVIVRYDAEADVLYVKLRDEPPVDAVEDAGGIVISYNEDGMPVSVEFLNASGHGLLEASDPRVTVAGLRAREVR